MASAANRTDVNVGGGMGKFCHCDLICTTVKNTWPASAAFLKPLLLACPLLPFRNPVSDCKMKGVSPYSNHELSLFPTKQTDEEKCSALIRQQRCSHWESKWTKVVYSWVWLTLLRAPDLSMHIYWELCLSLGCIHVQQLKRSMSKTELFLAPPAVFSLNGWAQAYHPVYKLLKGQSAKISLCPSLSVFSC